MNIKEMIKRHVDTNNILYFVLGITFIIGLLIGTLRAIFIDPDRNIEIAKELMDFFSVYSLQSANSNQLFWMSLLNNVRSLLIIFVFGFFAFGTIGIVLQMILRGLLLGSSIAFLTKMCLVKGFLFSLCSLLPQNIIFMPSIIIYSVLTIGHKFNLKKKTSPHKVKRILVYNILNFSIFLIIASICSMIEAYVTPIITHW